MIRAMSDREKRRLRARAGWIAVAAVLIASVALAVVLAAEHRRDQRQREGIEAERVAQALNMSSGLTVAQLESIGSLVEREPGSVPHHFADLTGPLVRANLAESFLFLELADPRDGPIGGIPTPGGRHYVPSHASGSGPLDRIRPADDESARRMHQALVRAGRAGEPLAGRAARIEGAPGTHLMVARAIGSTTPGASRGSAPAETGPGRSFVAVVIPVARMVESAEILVPAGTDVNFVGEGGRVLANGDQISEDHSSATVVVADRELELRLRVPSTASILLPALIGAGGLIIALTMAILLLTWSRRERAALELARRRVTERDRALKAEADMNRMYRLLAENLTDLVVVSDLSATITYASPACRPMLGWEPEEMLGRSVFDLIHPDDLAAEQELVAELAEAPAVKTVEHRVLSKDGDYVWVESAMRSVEDAESGEVSELQATSRDISARKPLLEQLERLAREDPLTGLVNRRGFREVLAAEASRSGRSDADLAILMVDVDHFKQVNDEHGHLVGDRLLQFVSRQVRGRLRSSDTLARFGGDELAAILPDTDEVEAMVVAAEVAASVREGAAGIEVPEVTVSIGVAARSEGGAVDPEVLLERADEALYEAKRGGRDEIRAFRAEAGSSPAA